MQNSRRKKILAIDIDDTIVDKLGKHILLYNSEFSTQLKKSHTENRKIYESVPEEHVQRVKSYPEDPRFFSDLKPFGNAIETIYLLKEYYEIYIVTAAMEFPTSFDAKYKWLAKNLPFIPPSNFVFCGTKNIIHADYLIDDTPKHLEEFSGVGVLYDAPQNQSCLAYPRVRNWDEVLDLFMAWK